MNVKQFPNPNNSEWIDKYNKLVIQVKEKEAYFKEYKKTQPKRNDAKKIYDKNNVGIHHIIPSSLDKSLRKEKDNLLYVPFDLHILLHYYLWKADWHYANQFKFIAAAARSWKICELPGGEDTWKQLVIDSTNIRKEKKKNESL